MEAFVTLVATDSYASGALVIAHRLRDLGTKRDLVCLVTPNISSQVQTMLSRSYKVFEVDTIQSQDTQNLELLGRPDLDITFTKIQAWRLVQYQKIVFLDADIFPLQNIDALFDRPSFSAAPDAGWPDCFNSGVFVTEPSESTYSDLMNLASNKGSFDGGDQGLLNTYFSSWPDSPSHRLPFTFNTTPTAQYGYAPAQVQYGHQISIVHFIGQNKPWKYQRFEDGKVLPMGDSWEGTSGMVQEWWNTWDKYYGRISPYHLLSGNTGHYTFDDGFKTRPIVPFSELPKNAWENEKYDIDDDRKIINPMPPISTITMTQPDWLQEELNMIYEHEHSHERHKNNQDNRQRPSHDHQDQTYSMIQWDPAHEDPPNTGTLGANIPDLSSYKNVWDQSLQDQQQHVWVAPVFHPEPEIMMKPEYAHYREMQEQEERERRKEASQGKEHNQEEHIPGYCQEENHKAYHQESNHEENYEDYHQEEHYQKENHNEVHHQEEHYQEEHRQEEYHQEEYHQEEHRQEEHRQEEYRQEEYRQEEHRQEEHRQEEYRQEEYRQEEYRQEKAHEPEHEEVEIIYPDAFPWESNPEHFPAPTRVWQDEIYHHVETQEDIQPGYIERAEEASCEESYEHVEKSEEAIYVDYQEEHVETHTTHDAVDTHEQVKEIVETHENHNEQSDITEQVEASIQVIESQQETIQVEKDQEMVKVHDDHIAETSMFAIDEAISPSVQTRIVEFIANLQEEEDDDISDRDLIPINFKPSSKLQSGVYTPSPLGSRNGSRVNSRSGSRRSSIASSRRNSLPGNQKRPMIDAQPSLVMSPVIKEQSSTLFASDKVSVYNRKTPYTSAAVTPAAVVEETDEYFYGSNYDASAMEGQDDFFQPSTYCLSDSLELAHQTKSPAAETWSPLDALTKLKSQSESMFLKQNLTEALNRAVKEQEELDHLEQLGPAKEPQSKKKKKSTAFRSIWDNEEEEQNLPSALLSGYSSPRTPVIRDLNSDLSNEIEHEKERYRQQRESLKIAEPHNAVATLLEAELDLSRGTLFKRRHYEAQIEPVETQDSLPLPKEEKEEDESLHLAYYSVDVMMEAQRRLGALKSGKSNEAYSDEPLPLPTETFVSNKTDVSKPSPVSQTHESKSLLCQAFENKSYRSNFGFNEHHKLKIYRSDLIEPEVIATLTDALEIKDSPLSKNRKMESATEEDAEKDDVLTESLVELKGLQESSGILDELRQDVTKTQETLTKSNVAKEEDRVSTEKVIEEEVLTKIEGIEKVEKVLTEKVAQEETLIGSDTAKEKEEILTERMTGKESPIKTKNVERKKELVNENTTREETSSDEDWVSVPKEKSSEENVLREEILTTSDEDLITVEKVISFENKSLEQNTSFETKEIPLQVSTIEEMVVPGIQDVTELIRFQKEQEKVKETLVEEAAVEEVLDLVEVEVESLSVKEKFATETNIEESIKSSKELTEELVADNQNINEEVSEQTSRKIDVEVSVETDQEENDDDFVEAFAEHYGVELLEVDSDIVELDLEAEDAVEIIEVEEKTLEIETVDHNHSMDTMELNDELLEIETSDDELHVEILELEEDNLEIESIEEEFEVETMEIEEEETVTQEEEAVVEPELIEISEEVINTEKNNQAVDVEVIEITREILETEADNQEVDSKAIEIETSTIKSEDTSHETTLESTETHVRDLDCTTETRIINQEPLEIIYEASETEVVDGNVKTETIETKEMHVETMSREFKAIEMKGSLETLTESVTSEIIGSPSSYFTSRSMMSSTESIRGHSSMPIRKMSIAESLLSSSRSSVASITTTPVIVEAFEKHGESSASKSDIVSRVRTYAKSRATSMASLETASVSSQSPPNTRPPNPDPKPSSSP